MAIRPTTLTLPQVKEEYSRDVFQQLVDYIQALERAVYRKDAHVRVAGAADAGSREPYLIIDSPDGTPWALEVDNSGTLTPRDVSGEPL